MRRRLFYQLATVFFISSPLLLHALPEGCHPVTGGGQTIVSAEEQTMLIQSGHRTILEWENFSIDSQEKVIFSQAGPDAAVLNRVIGGNASELLGRLSSNGAVFLINPNGILIGPEALIETGGFLASTLHLSNNDFLLNQALSLQGQNAAGIENQGTISCPYGDIYLIAKEIENSGTIAAEDGRVGLCTGMEVLLHPKEAPHVYIRSPLNENESLQDLASDVNPYARGIRHSGRIRAHVYAGGEEGGAVYLIAGGETCEISGQIMAPGGLVEMLGENVHLIENAEIDVSAPQGGGTIWVGGDYRGSNPDVPNAAHTWTSANTVLKANATQCGDGGTVILWGDEANWFYGAIEIRGGPTGGNGGFAEVSAPYLNYQGLTDGRAPLGKTGELLLDPTDITINGSTTSGTWSSCVPPISYTVGSGNTNNIWNTDLQNQLASCNVTVSTVSTGGSGSNSGAITVSSAVTWSSTNTLTLIAASFISINAAVTNTSTQTTPDFSAIVLTANTTGISINSGGLLQTGSGVAGRVGDITLTGTVTTGINSGIVLNTASGAAAISTSSGNISVMGTVSTGSASEQHGVSLTAGNGIQSAAGTITITGKTNATGGSSTGANFSVSMPAVTSGLVTIQGTSSGTTTSNGVGVSFGSGLTTGGALTVSGTAYASGTGSDTLGIYTNGQITAAGNVMMLGQAGVPGTPGGEQIGFDISAGISTSGTTMGVPNYITLIGNTLGPSGTSTACYGVEIKSGVTIQAPGAISIGGSIFANTTSTAAIYVGVSIAGHISSTSGGGITISGTNACSYADSYGVSLISGSSFSTTGMLTFGGQVQMTYNNVTTTVSGCIGGTGATSHGLNVASAVSIIGDIVATNAIIGGNGSGSVGFNGAASFGSTGAGNISITASSMGTGAAHGISLSSGALSTTGTGTITLIGNGSNLSTGGYGVLMASAGGITSGSGAISVTGTSFAIGADSGAYGVSITQNWSALTTATLSITGLGSTHGSGTANHGIDLGATLTNAGNISLNGTAGSGAGSYGIYLDVSPITTTASGSAVTLTGSTLLGVSMMIDTTNGGLTTGGNIVFSGAESTIDGTNALTLKAGGGSSGGSVTFGGVIGGSTALGSLNVASASTSAGAVNIGENITAASFAIATVSPAVLIAASGTTAIVSSGVISFGGKIDGSSSGTPALTLSAGGAVTLSGDIGDSDPLGAFLISSASNLSIGAANLAANSFTVSSGIATVLNNASGLTITTSSGSGSHAIDFGGTIDGVSSEAPLLTLAAGGSGLVTLAGAIGASQPLGAITVSSASDLDLNGTAITAGALTVGSGIATALNNVFGLTIATSGGSGSHAINFGGTIDGASNLILTTGSGPVTFSGAVGTNIALSSLSASSSGTITLDANSFNTAGGAILFPNTGIVALSTDVTLNTTSGGGSADISISGPVMNAITSISQTLTLNPGASSSVTFGSTVGATGSRMNLTFESGDALSLGGNIYLNGSPGFNPAPAMATTLTNNVTIDTDSGVIAFSSTIDSYPLTSYSLALTGGTAPVSLQGAVGGNDPLNVLTVSTTDTGSLGGFNIGANITANALDVVSVTETTLRNTSIITTLGSGGIAFYSTIDGAYNLTLAGEIGPVTLLGAVGSLTPLGTLTVSTSNVLAGGFNLGIAIDAASLDASGAVKTTLTADAAITTSSASGINFGGTIDGTSPDAQNLTLDAGALGSIIFAGAAGSEKSLGVLQIVNCINWTTELIQAISITQLGSSGSGTTLFQGPLITSSFIDLTGYSFTFDGFVADGSFFTVANTNLLAVNASVEASGAFLQEGGGTVWLGADVTTTGGPITFTDAVLLTGNAEISSNGTGDILFNSTIDGTYDLAVTAGFESVTFEDPVGSDTALNSLSVQGTTITVTGNQSVAQGPMTYEGDMIFTTSSVLSDYGFEGNLSIEGTVTAPSMVINLSALSAGITVSGLIDLAGAAGSGNPGGSFAAQGKTDVILGGDVLCSGGANLSGTGGNGGSIILTSNSGSISTYSLSVSGGDGSTGGDGGSILIQPSSGIVTEFGGNVPSGIITFNADLGGDCLVQATGGTGTAAAGADGYILLSANRSSPVIVATIVSSLAGNNLTVNGGMLFLGNYEVLTILGSITLDLSQKITLGDCIALEDLTISAPTTVTLVNEGYPHDILNSSGILYTTPSLHLFGGTGYSASTLFAPPNPRAADLGYSVQQFQPLLSYNGMILNYDTTLPPTPPSPSENLKIRTIYKIGIAQAEFFDRVPVFYTFPYPTPQVCYQPKRGSLQRECFPLKKTNLH